MKWRNFIQDLVLIIIGVILSIIPEKSEFTEMLTTFFITGGVVKLVWDFIVIVMRIDYGNYRNKL